MFDAPKALLTLKRRHFLYSAVMTFHLRFQYLPSKIIACLDEQKLTQLWKVMSGLNSPEVYYEYLRLKVMQIDTQVGAFS